MKMIYGGVPVNSLKVRHYEMDTNDCDMIASDLQAGKTAVARGKKIVGTGKSFEFATYGESMTNLPIFVPTTINVIQIGSLVYSIKTNISMYNTSFVDFTSPKQVAEVIIDGVNYPLMVSVQNGMLTISCDKTIDIELFYGKDNYNI